MSIAKPKLIVILGPTASGKTELSLKLAEYLANRSQLAEIVSADSRQIYKEMDIGTAKPICCRKEPYFFCHCEVAEGDRSNLANLSLRGGHSPISLSRLWRPRDKLRNLIIPHHLIDIVRPDQNFTLAQYQKLAIKTIKDIQKRGKIPFLVGGTGLYIQAVVDNLKIPKVKPDKKLRRKLEKLTAEQLSQKLQKLDPMALKFVDPTNKRRIVRALEVCLTTKKPFSRQRKKGKELFDVLQIGIKVNKEELRKRLVKRTEKMFAAGLVNEVKNLLKKYSPDLPSMTGIGYQEIIQYLLSLRGATSPHRYAKRCGRERQSNLIPLRYSHLFLSLRGAKRRGNLFPTTINQAQQLINLRAYQYAKRQMTWFKKDKRIKWIENSREAKKLVKDFLD